MRAGDIGCVAKLRNTHTGDTLSTCWVSAGQAGKLFRFGRGDFLSLLDAQRSLASAEAAAAAARVQLVQDQVAVFLALGGGWR